MERGSGPTSGTGPRVEAGRELAVTFPELPIAAYLRFLAWGELTAATILADGTLESMARANGVRILDRSIQLLGALSRAAFDEAAAKAVRAGTPSLTFAVTAPLRVWSEGITNAVRFNEWAGEFRGSVGERLPKPTRDVETTFRRLLGAARETYATTA